MIGDGDVPITAEHLDAEGIAALLDRRQADLAGEEARGAVSLGTILTWSTGAEQYGIALADVREVAALPRPTRIPGAPAPLLGIVARRGLVYNLFDPAAALGAAAVSEAGGGHMILLRHDSPRIALRVTAVTGVASLGPDEPPLDGLTRFITTAEGERLALVSTPLLVERLLARGPMEG